MKTFLHSMASGSSFCFLISFFILRERREHKTFLDLLKIVPGLEEQLMNPSTMEEELQLAATMVRCLTFNIYSSTILYSCRRAPPVPDRMTQKV